VLVPGGLILLTDLHAALDVVSTMKLNYSFQSDRTGVEYPLESGHANGAGQAASPLGYPRHEPAYNRAASLLKLFMQTASCDHVEITWRCLGFKHRASPLASNVLKFLSQSPHAMSRHLDKFHDFRTSFAFCII
jgi:hypothetical protein